MTAFWIITIVSIVVPIVALYGEWKYSKGYHDGINAFSDEESENE